MKKIKEYLDNTKSNYRQDSSKLEEMLSEHWNIFEGNDSNGMEGYKLHKRMENVSWDSPILSFVIERHGSAARGSTRAELQHWEVNLDSLVACVEDVGYRQITPVAATVDVKPIARNLAAGILTNEKNEYLKWKSDNQVKVEFSALFKTSSGNRQTVAGRRRRCRNELERIVEVQGWQHTGNNVFIKEVSDN